MKPCPNCGMTEESDITVSDADDFQGLCPCGVCGPFGVDHEDGEKKWDSLPRREDAAELVEALEAFFSECSKLDDCSLMGISDIITEGTLTKMRTALAKWGK